MKVFFKNLFFYIKFLWLWYTTKVPQTQPEPKPEPIIEEPEEIEIEEPEINNEPMTEPGKKQVPRRDKGKKGRGAAGNRRTP
jgi:hypothetical protein